VLTSSFTWEREATHFYILFYKWYTLIFLWNSFPKT